ncbi:MAG: DNA cytosine methyltransferase [Selenomonadaceae bacterium]|nr:DNA cytosine methyltransferase [Selenomonadaceae bacterium]MBR4384186.1 DNA cytosine methyltransferase [Selenomonadaceae bacterium]
MQNLCRLLNTTYAPPLMARGAAAVATQKIVRRLTPIECERLQGLPDDWTAGGSDAARYKAIGNGMALPIAEFILRRIKEAEE